MNYSFRPCLHTLFVALLSPHYFPVYVHAKRTLILSVLLYLVLCSVA